MSCALLASHDLIDMYLIMIFMRFIAGLSHSAYVLSDPDVVPRPRLHQSMLLLDWYNNYNESEYIHGCCSCSCCKRFKWMRSSNMER
jgi:hypothetical protein